MADGSTSESVTEASNAPVSGVPQPPATVPDAEQLQQQLQLIQLCFGEDEFGISLGAETSADATVASPSDVGASTTAFDPSAFIHDKLYLGVPLNILCRDLDFFENYIRDKITQSVNNDLHTSFVNVSSLLVGMQEELLLVQRPLSSTLNQVNAACEQLSKMSEGTREKIKAASEVERERRFDITFLQGLLLYERLVDAANEIALDAEDSRATPTSPTVGVSEKNNKEDCTGLGALQSASTTPTYNSRTLAQLDALVMATHQLRVLGSFLAPLPQRAAERAEMERYIHYSVAAAHAALRRVFCAISSVYLKESATSVVITSQLRYVLKMYEQMGGLSEFCRMFREDVLRPVLERVLSWKAATQARQSVDETVRLLGALENEVEQHVLPLLPLLREGFHGHLYPSSMILWPSVCEVLVKKIVSLYECSIPEVFHRKYTAAFRLLALAERSCASVAELTHLRQSPDVALWNHKWNTDVYAALISTKVSKRLHSVLEGYRNKKPMLELMPSSAVESSRYQFPCLDVLHDALLELFSPEVFILPCASKLLRTAATSCEAVVGCLVRYCEDTQKNPDSEAEEDSTNWLHFAVALVADLDKLQQFFSGSLSLAACQVTETTIATSYSSLPVSAASEGSSNSVSDVLCFICDKYVRDGAKRVQDMITSSVVERCSAVLQNIRSVRSAYSHTKKPFPTTPSWYVPNINEPILQLATSMATQQLPHETQKALLTTALGTIMQQFAAIARDTLLTAKKTEESWEKLRRRREATGKDTAATSAADGGDGRRATRVTAETATDRDKMVVQLYLDANALAAAVAPLNVITDTFPPLYALQRLLRRAAWISGEDMDEPPELDEGDT